MPDLSRLHRFGSAGPSRWVSGSQSTAPLRRSEDLRDAAISRPKELAEISQIPLPKISKAECVQLRSEARFERLKAVGMFTLATPLAGIGTAIFADPIGGQSDTLVVGGALLLMASGAVLMGFGKLREAKKISIEISRSVFRGE